MILNTAVSNVDARSSPNYLMVSGSVLTVNQSLNAAPVFGVRMTTALPAPNAVILALSWTLQDPISTIPSNVTAAVLNAANGGQLSKNQRNNQIKYYI